MNAPFYQLDGFGYSTAMALATVLGVAFGFVLERAGFGHASVLVAQFYGRDMRVLKVMFTTIATTAAAVGLLAGIGWLDLAAMRIPETWYAPQGVGGFLLGIGFIVSGYCPGTGVVAMASGHMDGALALVGMMIGSLLFGLLYPYLAGFYESTAAGVVTIPELLGVPWAVVAVGVVVMAIGAQLAGEKVERLLARKDGVEPPPGPAGLRNRMYGGMVATAALALVVLALPVSGSAGDATAPSPSAVSAEPIHPVELGVLITGATTPVYLVDLRDPAACREERIHGAMCLPDDDLEASFVAAFPPTRPLTVYAQGNLDVLPAAVQSYQGPVRVLRGGFNAWRAQILRAPSPPRNPTPESVAAYRVRAALHSHFTGTATAAPPVEFQPKTTITRRAKKGGGC